jgi:vitamin B12 transporter
MKKYSVVCLAGLWLLACGAESFAEEPAKSNDEDEFLSLYFDEVQVVEAATRIAKPITQVAENVTIITAAEIERMNAHNVDDVLKRVAGVFVLYHGQDFNGGAFLSIHGSSWQQVVVYLDGVKISKASQDLTFANIVPIRIVKRIEVIKGAASSTWGSALGGVINIITKDTGAALQPTGSVHASYGEFQSQAYSAEVAGKVSRLGYYLSGATQKSDGLKDDKAYDNTSFYGKMDLELPAGMKLAVTSGYTAPEYKGGYFPLLGFEEDLDDRNLFYTASFDARVASNLNFHVNGYRYDNDYNRNAFALSDGSVWWDDTDQQKSEGLSGRLNWSLANQEIVAGVDYLRNDLQRSDELAGTPPRHLSEDLVAYYLNDTIRLGKLTVIPGLRLDSSNEVKDVVSPSLGATYLLSSDTLLRASISRGFRKPPVLWTDEQNGEWFANEELDPELVWSYQAGVETTAATFCRLKTTIFFHDAKDAIQWSSTTLRMENSGEEERIGFEVEVETLPWHDLTLAVNYTYSHLSNMDKELGINQEANVIITYDNPDIITLELSGHYANFGSLVAPPAFNPEDNSIIWELSVTRNLWRQERFQADLFMVGHNLTNDSQYVDELLPNGPRWLEAGMKFRF